MRVRTLVKMYVNNMTMSPARKTSSGATIPADVFLLPEKYKDGEQTPRWTEKDDATIAMLLLRIDPRLPREDGFFSDSPVAKMYGLPKSFNPSTMEMLPNGSEITKKGTRKDREAVGGGTEEVIDRPLSDPKKSVPKLIEPKK
jgi:hypothetical protein